MLFSEFLWINPQMYCFIHRFKKPIYETDTLTRNMNWYALFKKVVTFKHLSSALMMSLGI